MRTTLALLTLTVVLASACSGSSSTGPKQGPTYDSIAGTYSGPVSGLTQGISLSAVATVTITQSSATLGGSYGLSGTITDGITVVNIAGSGTISGTIASGNNPSVNVTVTGVCPGFQAQFSGAYDTANARLTLTGPIQIFYNDCSGVFLTYQETIIITR
jgi:hypothetical protein